MKKIKTILLALLLIIGFTPKVQAEETIDVCVLQIDEDGNVLNAQEYQNCLEENGYGVEPADKNWPGGGK